MKYFAQVCWCLAFKKKIKSAYLKENFGRFKHAASLLKLPSTKDVNTSGPTITGLLERRVSIDS